MFFFFHDNISGVTVMLSLTVFMNIVSELMPITSDAVPLVGRSTPHDNPFVWGPRRLLSVMIMIMFLWRNIFQLYHGDGGQQCPAHSIRPQLPPPQSWHSPDADLGKTRSSWSERETDNQPYILWLRSRDCSYNGSHGCCAITAPAGGLQ